MIFRVKSNYFCYTLNLSLLCAVKRKYNFPVPAELTLILKLAKNQNPNFGNVKTFELL